MAKKKKSGTIFELPVSYGDISIGQDTCRIGINIDRAELSVTDADESLCGKRLIGTIMARAGGAQSGQDSIPGLDSDIELTSVFDVKRFGVSSKAISAGLTFALKSVEVETLAHFAKRNGMFSVTDLSDIPEAETDETE